MNQSFFHTLSQKWIVFWGSNQGVSEIDFPEKTIVIAGDSFGVGLLKCFYINLPPNAYGVLIYPDGSRHRVNGGLLDLPIGRYSLSYIYKNIKTNEVSPVSEMTTDGEKISLSILVRYQISDPITILDIDNPVDTFFSAIETDVMQYIRTHDHTDIADSKDNQSSSNLFSFVLERHKKRHQLSRAFALMGIELKAFQGDPTFVSLRQGARVEEVKVHNDKLRLGYEQEIERIRAEYKAVMEKRIADNRAELETMTVKQRAEIETINGKHRAEMLDVLHQVRLVEEQTKRDQMREQLAIQAMEGIKKMLEPSAYPLKDISQITSMISGVIAGFEEKMADMDTDTSKPHAHSEHVEKPSGNIEYLKTTLLDLLERKPADRRPKE